jgi:hypothetical protein
MSFEALDSESSKIQSPVGLKETQAGLEALHSNCYGWVNSCAA